MKEKINIVEILKDKPQGTKLYSSACGKCRLGEVDDKSFKISFYNSKFGFMNGGEGYLDKNGKLYDDGECIVFPSKEMQDWSKFAWKKGDILVSRDKNIHLIFEKFIDDTYTIFVGKHCYEKNYRNEYNYERRFNGFKTEYFTLETEDAAQKYLKTIEEKLGGKLNRETLEIKKKTKFEDGDIAFADYGNRQYVFIVSGETGLSEGYNSSIYLDLSGPTPSTAFRTSFFKKDLCELRLATEEEKKQLFSALEEKGKRWDSDKKAIVDVKPKWTPKPFDKVLVRDSKSSKWRANLFSHKNIDEPYYCVYASWNYCIPYEGNEHLLGTTENVKE